MPCRLTLRFVLRRTVLLAILLGAVPLVATAGDWPGFLGPGRNGRSPETGLNFDWNTTPPKILWKRPLGAGFSSIAVAGDRLFTQAEKVGRQYVVCLDAASGKTVWQRHVAPGYADKQRMGSGPRSTPTIENGRVYCLFPRGELLCMTAEAGETIWKTNIFTATGCEDPTERLKYYWGMSASPLVEGDLVIVQPGGQRDNSVAAFDKKTGKLVWSAGSDAPGYGSPITVDAAGRRQVIGCTGVSILSLDPATGNILWRQPWGDKFHCNCATPVWTDRGLLVSTAYGNGTALLAITGSDGQPSVSEVWQTRDLQNHFGTSMIVDGYVFGCHGDLGTITFRCIELATGKKMWTSRAPGRCGMIVAEGHIIALGQRGSLYLIQPSPERYIEKGKLEGVLDYKAWTPPSLSGGRVFLRDQKSVVCVDLRK